MVKFQRLMIQKLVPFVLPAALIVVWHSSVSLYGSEILPGPWAVVLGLIDLARQGLLIKHVVASLFRVTWGYLIAVMIGIPLGLLLGWHRRGGMGLNPLLQVLRPISPLAWIPLSILWFGVGDNSAIFLIFLASFLPLTVSAMNTVRNISVVHLNVGRNFGLTPSQLLRRVILPAVMPRLVVGLRISLGIAWMVVVAAEMIAVNSGLGFLIIDARNAGNRYDLVIAGIAVIGLIGLFLDTTFRKLERLQFLRWSLEEM